MSRPIPNENPDDQRRSEVERALAMAREPVPVMPNASPAVALAAIQAARAAILEAAGAGAGHGRKPRWVKPPRDLEHALDPPLDPAAIDLEPEL